MKTADSETRSSNKIVGRIIVVKPKGSVLRAVNPSTGDVCAVIKTKKGWRPLKEENDIFNGAYTALSKTGEHVRYLIFPGGTIHFSLENIEAMKPGWNTDEQAIRLCERAAHDAVMGSIDATMSKKLNEVADFVSVGVDTVNSKRCPTSAEMVVVFSTKDRRVVGVTGKSYPIKEQEKTLLRVSDIQSHFMRVGGDRLLVLGCHDLNVFSPRVHANVGQGSNRATVIHEFIRLTKAFKPTVVLQHPHMTDSSHIWKQGWSGIRQQLPLVKVYASALRVHSGKNKSPLSAIRRCTASCQQLVVDILYDEIKPNGCRLL